jgi:hypothetical protein
MVIYLRHVVKLGGILFDSGAHLVVLGRFHCSHWGMFELLGWTLLSVHVRLMDSLLGQCPRMYFTYLWSFLYNKLQLRGRLYA